MEGREGTGDNVLSSRGSGKRGQIHEGRGGGGILKEETSEGDWGNLCGRLARSLGKKGAGAEDREKEDIPFWRTGTMLVTAGSGQPY